VNSIKKEDAKKEINVIFLMILNKKNFLPFVNFFFLECVQNKIVYFHMTYRVTLVNIFKHLGTVKNNLMVVHSAMLLLKMKKNLKNL